MIKTAIIMAGGSGERFWPLSTKNKPKQLLNLINEEKTLLEDSIDRIISIINPENIFIITGELIAPNIKKTLKKIPQENIIAEPFKRNTSACLALASSVIQHKVRQVDKREQIVCAVLTADQVMSPTISFQQDVNTAFDLAKKANSIVTIGITPTKPETGFGYIELGEKIDEESNNTFKVKSFKEKPDLDTAIKYVKSGQYLWNSGMFFYDLDYFNAELKKHLEPVGGKIDEMTAILSNPILQSQTLESRVHKIADIFEKMPDISIDFGLMEKTENVNLVKSSFVWDDVGSWDSLEKYLEKQGQNFVKGKMVSVDSKNNIIFNHSNDKLISLVGIDDLIVVNAENAILILPKDKAQDVKKIVTELKKQNSDLL